MRQTVDLNVYGQSNQELWDQVKEWLQRYDPEYDWTKWDIELRVAAVVEETFVGQAVGPVEFEGRAVCERTVPHRPITPRDGAGDSKAPWDA
jgi:hypothetical protein